MHNPFAAEQPSRAPQRIVQLVAYGNVLNVGYVESRNQALEELHRLNCSGRLDELAGPPDQDKYLILNVLPPLGVDQATLDFDAEVLLCSVRSGTDEHGDAQYQWIDAVGLLPEHIRQQLWLQ